MILRFLFVIIKIKKTTNMKNLQNYIIVIAVLFLQYSFGQTVDINKIITDNKFQELEKLGIEFYTSKSYEDGKKLNKDFREIVPNEFFKSITKFEDWIENNLSKTSFKSKEEALEFHKNLTEINKYNRIKLYKLLDLKNELSKNYGESNISYLYTERIVSKSYFIISTKQK